MLQTNNTSTLLFKREIYYLDEVKRFNNQPVIKSESTSQHSFWVEFFAFLLFNDLFKKVEKIWYYKLKTEIQDAAKFHDYLEFITGDVNHNLKYNDYNGEFIRKYLKEYEDKLILDMQKQGGGMSAIADSVKLYNDNEFIHAFCKVCDWLALIKNIKQETDLGNITLSEIFGKTKLKTNIAIDNLIMQLNSNFGNDYNKEILVELKHKIQENL